MDFLSESRGGSEGLSLLPAVHLTLLVLWLVKFLKLKAIDVEIPQFKELMNF